MSDKPVAERLQVKGGRRLAVVGAPAALDRALGAPEARAGLAAAEVVVLAAADLVALRSTLPGVLAAMLPAAVFWIAYPKLTSRLAADLSRDIIRGLGPDYGLDTVSQIAIDDDWSALRLKRVG
jgi:hypothetical protein